MNKSAFRISDLSATIPAGATAIAAVTTDAKPLGSVLIRYETTGKYALLNAGCVSSCDQREAVTFVVRELIARSGLTQAAFAERYHIPKRTVEDWATGKHNPPVYVPYLIEQLMEAELVSRGG